LAQPFWFDMGAGAQLENDRASAYVEVREQLEDLNL